MAIDYVFFRYTVMLNKSPAGALRLPIGHPPAVGSSRIPKGERCYPSRTRLRHIVEHPKLDNWSIYIYIYIYICIYIYIFIDQLVSCNLVCTCIHIQVLASLKARPPRGPILDLPKMSLEKRIISRFLDQFMVLNMVFGQVYDFILTIFLVPKYLSNYRIIWYSWGLESNLPSSLT